MSASLLSRRRMSLDPALPELCLIPHRTVNISSHRSPCRGLSEEKVLCQHVGGDLSFPVVDLVNCSLNWPHLPLPKKAKIRSLMVL